MKIIYLVLQAVVALVFSLDVIAQTSAPSNPSELAASASESLCSADRALLLGKWDGAPWSFARTASIFEVVAIIEKNDKCVLQFKFYQQTRENKDKGILFEAILDGKGKDSFQQEVDRPSATLSG